MKRSDAAESIGHNPIWGNEIPGTILANSDQGCCIISVNKQAIIMPFLKKIIFECMNGILGHKGYSILFNRTQSPPYKAYDQDGLFSIHNYEFTLDPAFMAAYERGMKAAHGKDFSWHWRVHVGLWVAQNALRLEGDFVECGVGNGFLSSAIMKYLDWNSKGKQFYLLDTFAGVDVRYTTEAERKNRDFEAENKQHKLESIYASSFESVEKNFSEWHNVHLIKGTVPESLPECKAKIVSYLHLDMNCSPPEIAALNYFWDKLVQGAFILLDDYAYHGFREQKLGMDKCAAEKGVKILSLPTGQGLIIK
jgi:hypothetical protein